MDGSTGGASRRKQPPIATPKVDHGHAQRRTILEVAFIATISADLIMHLANGFDVRPTILSTVLDTRRLARIRQRIDGLPGGFSALRRR